MSRRLTSLKFDTGEFDIFSNIVVTKWETYAGHHYRMQFGGIEESYILIHVDLSWPYGVDQGAVSIRKTVLPGMAIPMLKIRRPNGRLIFNMENAIRRKDGLYIETGPCFVNSASGNGLSPVRHPAGPVMSYHQLNA